MANWLNQIPNKPSTFCQSSDPVDGLSIPIGDDYGQTGGIFSTSFSSFVSPFGFDGQFVEKRQSCIIQGKIQIHEKLVKHIPYTTLKLTSHSIVLETLQCRVITRKGEVN